ncbi:hypothetical protein [Gaopeijia maritima]|uniref:hypothetical protein n=1 Tax=Gaopeijia maritima TaxID=3119007 RepID=UPI00327649CB
MTQMPLFEGPPAPPPPPDRPQALQGVIPAGAIRSDRAYRWTLHLDRIGADWQETRDSASGALQPPGWAFGLLYPYRGEWRGVRAYQTTWAGWAIVRDLPAVREAIGPQLLPPTDTP